MKAAVHTRYGPPQVVRVQEVPTPAPAAGEVLVEVKFTTVNRTDCAFRAAHPFFIRAITGLRKPKQKILGTEFAGVVAGLGAGVDQFQVGDRVFGYSEKTFGAHAEFLTMPQDGAITTIPAGVPDELAAASTEASHYALAIIRKAKIKTGDSVLVYGSSGGIGSAAVQLLKAQGSLVTAVCGPEAVALMSQLGADHVIDRIAQDFTQDTERYDFVLDAVGKSTFRVCRPLLRARGIYLTTDLGPGGQVPFLQLATSVLPGKSVMIPIPGTFDKDLIEEFAGFLDSGQFRPVLDERRFTLDDIVSAHDYVDSEQKMGNVLVEVSATA